MNKDILIANKKYRTKCEIWTRVMGYHRPISEFNTGKKSEYAERHEFKEIIERKERMTS
jgi:anaerobic ribonucleoside-triphosphate reductase